MIRTALLGATLVCCGCTAAHTVALAGRVGRGREIIVTTVDLDQPYRPIGVGQVTVTGLWLFGCIDLVPASLDRALKDALTAEAEKAGADAITNLRAYELQYPPLLKAPSVVTVLSPQYAMATGELVEFIR